MKDISELAQKMIQTRKDKVYPLVYRLLMLALILSVATANVERVFSSINVVKTQLGNRIGNQWMNDSLVIYNEKEIYDKIDNVIVMQHFTYENLLGTIVRYVQNY